MTRCICLSAAVSAALALAPVRAATFYVSTTGSDAPGTTGEDWANAFLTISNAVAHAGGGDTITVSNGTYTITAEISITDSITLQSVNGYSNTIVTRSGTATNRIFYVNDPAAIIDGFTIRNGLAHSTLGSGTAPLGYGGGVFLESGAVVNCLVENNSGDGSTSALGAGMYCGSGAVVRDCVIRNNTAASGGNAIGGGLYCTGGAVVENSAILTNKTWYREGGGVWLDAGCVISNCVIRGNIANYTSGYIWNEGGGLVTDCVIEENFGHSHGVYLKDSGTIRNSLIRNNLSNQGSAVWGLTPHLSIVQNCTVTLNTTYYTGVYSAVERVTVSNSIVYFNKAHQTASPNYANSVIRYSCTTPLPSGDGNTSADPQFVDGAAGNHRLRPGSPAIDAGYTNGWDWLAGATDLDGVDPRVSGVSVDMGCYEFTPAALRCGMVADTTAAQAPVTAVFTGHVEGTNTAGVVYTWDFGDGSPAASGQTVTNTYAAGMYSPSLTVVNAIGETHICTRTNYIRSAPAVAYVATNGMHVSPFTNWITAATNVQDAVDVCWDGSLIRVADGTYALTRQVSIRDGITVRSENGYAQTVLLGNGQTRCLRIDHADAVVDGFTISNGNPVDERLAFSDFYATVQWHGGGIHLYRGGTVQNCLITGNSGDLSTQGGGACLIGGGTLRSCLIQGNLLTHGQGGGVYIMSGYAMIDNCTIVSNRAYYNDNGAGVRIWHYPVVGPHSLVRNSIILYNYFSHPSADPTWRNYSSAYADRFLYCCSVPKPTGAGSIDDDPLFVDPLGDYHLTLASPCINTGTNLQWALAGDATDLDRMQRKVGPFVDMGCFEGPPAGAVFFLR